MRSTGLRITKVGMWFAAFVTVVLLAATNTGNNGLFLVLAVMASAVAVSGLVAAWNVRGLEIRLRTPAEIFVNAKARLGIEVTNRSRWLGRWMLVLTIEPRRVRPRQEGNRLRRERTSRSRSTPLLVPHLGRGATSTGDSEILMHRRGRYRVETAGVWSLFPLGFFRQGKRYPIQEERRAAAERRREPAPLEFLVYPEIFAPAEIRPIRTGKAGAEETRRAGWGHDLFALRSYRSGDDPRSIHWKQSARTGKLISKERESEENRRLLIVVDNATGLLVEPADRRRFERLVSEAATAAVDHLASGYEVALQTREVSLAFASGSGQRRQILEALALIEALPAADRPLAASDPELPHMRLALELGQAAARRPAGRRPREAAA